MKQIKIHLIVGTRPNFMKVAPLYHALKTENWAITKIIYTGQHYDKTMSDVFFQDLGLPEPDYSLKVGSNSHAKQTAAIMSGYEDVCLEDRPDLTLVVGDVNSTMACALVAKKLEIPVAHLEAGLRSFDRRMPEEINRIVTDSISDLFLTPSKDADQNLIHEGVPLDNIKFVGNIMIDVYEMLRQKIEKIDIFKSYSLEKKNYCLVTFHRPSNVDNKQNVESIINALMDITQKMPVVFPMHPRTANQLEKFNYLKSLQNMASIHILEPQSYINFMSLMSNSRFVLTDSGGIQEETSYLGIPCITLRESTERPITVTEGTNHLSSFKTLYKDIENILSKNFTSRKIDLWDGKTAIRVVHCLKEYFNVNPSESINDFCVSNEMNKVIS